MIATAVVPLVVCYVASNDVVALRSLRTPFGGWRPTSSTFTPTS